MCPTSLGPARRLLFALALVLALVIGCERSAPAPAVSRSSEPVTKPPPGPRIVPLSPRLRRPAVERLVAIGDLHGDLEATRSALRLAGAIDTSDKWVGGKLVVVQTGDQIDRGDADRGVLDFIEQLRGAAREAGGELIALSGNHELMNVAGDLRYVTQAGFDEFEGVQGRIDAFRPGGRYARLLAARPLLVQVGDTVFVHGGILRKHVAYGLDRMNDEVRAWLRGERASPPEVVLAEDGVVWTRVYGMAPADCAELDAVLRALHAKRMVIGHTVQQDGITSDCGERLFRIDVGMSRYYGGRVQVLELRGPKARALAPN